MIRGIFDLFDAEARAEKKSHADYSACHEFTRTAKRQLRENLVREILFAHEDATFLISDFTSRGVAFSPSAGIIYRFEIGDEMVPKVEFVAHDAKAPSREAAVSTFQRHIQGGFPFYQHQWDKNFENRLNRHWRELDENFWNGKGHRIDKPEEIDEYFGLKLVLNERVVARLNPWEPKPDGYLVRSLSESVMGEPPNPTGSIHAIDILLYSDLWSCACESSTSIIYDGRSDFQRDGGVIRFQREFAGVAAFLTAIEPFIKIAPKDWSEHDGLKDAINTARSVFE